MVKEYETKDAEREEKELDKKLLTEAEISKSKQLWENDPMVKTIWDRNRAIPIDKVYFKFSENGAKRMIADALLFGFMTERKRLLYSLLNSFEKRIRDIDELPINHPLKREQENYLAGMREIVKELYLMIEFIEKGDKE